MSKKLSAKEELEDMGIEIIEYPENESGPALKKIPIWVQFYDDGSWAVDSSDDIGGAANTLGTGENLISILPVLRNIRDIFLKSLKERKEKCWLCKKNFDIDDLREWDDDLFCDDCWEEFKEEFLDEDDY